MARYVGKDGGVSVGGVEIGEVESFEANFTVNQSDANVMGEDWTGVASGQKSMTGSLSLLRDPDNAGQAALSVGDEVAIVLYPEGNTTGRSSIVGTVLITEAGVAVAVGDINKQTVSFRNQGTVTEPAVT